MCKVATLCVILLLVGCVSREERQARQVSNARATCLAVGFKDGTNEMANCTMNGVQRAQDQRRADQQRALDNLTRPAPAPPKQTICNVMGNTVVCN
jgi:hypothetical protein